MQPPVTLDKWFGSYLSYKCEREVPVQYILVLVSNMYLNYVLDKTNIYSPRKRGSLTCCRLFVQIAVKKAHSFPLYSWDWQGRKPICAVGGESSTIWQRWWTPKTYPYLIPHQQPTSVLHFPATKNLKSHDHSKKPVVGWQPFFIAIFHDFWLNRWSSPTLSIHFLSAITSKCFPNTGEVCGVQ